MGLFTSKKNLCPVCGEPTPRLFPTKVEGNAICKECSKKIYLPNGKLEQMTLDEFLQYMNFYEENGALRDNFTSTYEYLLPLSSAGIFLDMPNGWFRLKNLKDTLVFESSCLKCFRVLEGENVIFESQGNALRCYESNVPQQIRAMSSEIDEFRIQRQKAEFNEEMEQRRKEEAERRGEDYQARYIYKPYFDNHEPFDSFYIELTLEHPYWNEVREEVYGPSFNREFPSVDAFLYDYDEKKNKLHELALNLMQLICPGAGEINDANCQGQEGICVTREVMQDASTKVDAIEEIKKYKELMDAGIITEEEFVIKKRQLMGI